jgi:hypothetical protein
MLILSLTGNVVFEGSRFTTVAHGLVVVRVPETIELEGVSSLEFTECRVLSGDEEAGES